jgi:hypothetical protein
MKSFSVLKWTEKVSHAGLVAIGTVFVACFVTVGFLSVTMLTGGKWHDPQALKLSLQVLHLLAEGIAFAILIWGFWGGFASATGACLTVFVVSVVTGHISDYKVERLPFFMECLLFILIAWLCIQFLQRESFEEKTDRRQLEKLEEEYLTQAIEFGKRDDLLKVLMKKQERMAYLENMGARLKAAGGMEQSVQMCLGEIVKVLERGEAEITVYTATGITRYARGAPPAAIEGGRDEIDRWLDEHRTSLLVNNLTHDVRFTPGFGKTRQIMSLVAVPLIWEGELKGTLRLTSIQPQAFTHEDLRLVSDAAGMLLPCLFPAA